MNLVSLFLVMMENHLEFGTWESRSAPNNYLYSHACAASFAQNLVTCPSLCFFLGKQGVPVIGIRKSLQLFNEIVHICVCVCVWIWTLFYTVDFNRSAI